MAQEEQAAWFASCASRITETPVMLFDPRIAQHQCESFRTLLPNIDLTFAVKCMPEEVLVEAIDSHIDGYDVASLAEIEFLLGCGVTAERMSYGNPVKPGSSVRRAAELGVGHFAFQSDKELDKIALEAPGASVYLRIGAPPSSGALDFSSKFGANFTESVDLMDRAVKLGLRPTGITFHVGSQAQDPAAWVGALGLVEKILTSSRTAGVTVREINIGGGFPVPYTADDLRMDDLAAVVGPAIARIRDRFPEVRRVVAEPGRYLTAGAGCVVTSVIGREVRHGKNWLYLDVGTFQSFVEVFEFGRFVHPVHSLRHFGELRAPMDAYVLTGPTCDSFDTLTTNIALPAGLEEGDKLLIGMSGAYTTAYGSSFNGFDVPKLVVAGHADTNRAVACMD